MPMRPTATVLALSLATVACSGIGMAPKAESLVSTRLAQPVTAKFCIRDDAGIGQSLSGSISSADCNDSAGYYETYMVKVLTPREVTFAVDSRFDSFLALVEVASMSDTDYSGELLGYDDDSNGRSNAKLTMALQPGVDYALMVSGLDHKQTGEYVLTVR